jgi:hypothetical protein
MAAAEKGRENGIITTKLKGLARIAEYTQTPNKCEACDTNLLYQYRNNKFCSHSCAATATNKERNASGWKMPDSARSKISKWNKDNPNQQRICHISECKECGKLFSGYRKTVCSKQCFSTYQSKNAHKNKLGANGSRQGCKPTYRKDSFGATVRLESSYEVKMANILDILLIKWNRPEPILYLGPDKKQHRYYPDFYLPDSNVYLDPKNKHLIEEHRDKICRVMAQNNVSVHVIPFALLNIDSFREYAFSQNLTESHSASNYCAEHLHQECTDKVSNGAGKSASLSGQFHSNNVRHIVTEV